MLKEPFPSQFSSTSTSLTCHQNSLKEGGPQRPHGNRSWARTWIKFGQPLFLYGFVILKLYDSQRHLVAVSKYAHVQTCECLVSCRQNVCFRYTVQTETYSAVTSRNTYIYTTTSCGWWGWSRCDTTRSVNIFQKKNILLKLISFCLRQKGYIKWWL